MGVGAGLDWGLGWLTALVDHVERDVGEVVVFEEVVGRAGESAYEDRVVLRRYESDGSEAQVHLPGHFLSVRLRAKRGVHIRLFFLFR